MNQSSSVTVVSCRHTRSKPSLLYFAGMIMLVLLPGSCQHSTDRSDVKLPVRIEPILIDQLGAEHFGNAIYRRGMNGPRIAASGNRILEWPIQVSAPATEVVPHSAENYSNGACAMDINGDGIDEMIVGRRGEEDGTDLLWFEEVPAQKQWKEHWIANVKGREGDAEKTVHDIMPFEAKVSGNPVRGVAIVVSRKRLYWYQAPDDITQPWNQYMIADLSEHGAEYAQSGLVLGDIAGTGRQDVVCGNFWVECPADPTIDPWKVHRYSNWDRRKTPEFPDVPAWVKDEHFGGMNQLDLGDMDGDGKLDIVASDAEIPEARVGVFCRDTDNPRDLWKEILLDTGIYCSHSLVVVDVNNDNRPDVIVGEMTAGGWFFPRNSNPKLYLYLNEGNLNFRKFVLHEGWGIHMMRMAPKQPDGKIFLFAADEIQSWYEDMSTHIVGWTLAPNL